jgi:hypothetical protein
LKSLASSEVVESPPIKVLTSEKARLGSLIEQVLEVYQDGTRGAGYSGAANFLFTDRDEEVVTRVKMVESVRSRDAEDEARPGDGQNWGFSLETSHIFQNWAITAFGDPNRAEGSHLLQAGP